MYLSHGRQFNRIASWQRDDFVPIRSLRTKECENYHRQRVDWLNFVRQKKLKWIEWNRINRWFLFHSRIASDRLFCIFCFFFARKHICAMCDWILFLGEYFFHFVLFYRRTNVTSVDFDDKWLWRCEKNKKWHWKEIETKPCHVENEFVLSIARATQENISFLLSSSKYSSSSSCFSCVRSVGRFYGFFTEVDAQFLFSLTQPINWEQQQRMSFVFLWSFSWRHFTLCSSTSLINTRNHVIV